MFICDISVLNKYGKQRLDKMLMPMQLDWRELVVILVIEQVPGISQTRMIPFLQTDKANVTKLLQAMEKKDLIKRVTDNDDQRNKICHLSPWGQQLVPQLHSVLIHWEATCFHGIQKDEMELYQKISAMISQNLLRDWQT